MPSFTDDKRERIILPSTADKPEAEQRWIDVNLNLTIGAVLDVSDTLADNEKTLQMLSKVIVGWNNTAADGTPVEITVDSIKQIGLADFTFLAEKIGNVLSPDGGDPKGHELKSPEAADASPARLG